MRAIASWFLGTVIVCSIGCAPSEYPLFEADDVIFDPALLGTWRSEEEEDTWRVQEKRDAVYSIASGDDSSRVLYEAQLAELGEYRFLNISIPAVGDSAGGFHMISRIWVEEDEIRIGILSPSWLRYMRSQGKVAIDFVGLEERLRIPRNLLKLALAYNGMDLPVEQVLEQSIYLTSPTEAIRRMAIRYAEDPEAFPISIVLRRIEDSG